MAIILPTVEGANSSFTTTLEGNRYRFNLKWNSRSETWHLSIQTDDGVPIITGQKVLPRLETVLHNEELFADGNVFAISSILDDDELITRDNLGVGKTYQLYYVPQEEANRTVQAWQL